MEVREYVPSLHVAATPLVTNVYTVYSLYCTDQHRFHIASAGLQGLPAMLYINRNIHCICGDSIRLGRANVESFCIVMKCVVGSL